LPNKTYLDCNYHNCLIIPVHKVDLGGIVMENLFKESLLDKSKM